MVRLETGFVTGPSCAASAARAPLSVSLRCVQHHLHAAAAWDLTVIITIVMNACESETCGGSERTNEEREDGHCESMN